MKRIKQLSKQLVNQITAGEVIERPASVVKELVENAIDAGATKIEIDISNDSRNIRIADNGSGIHPDDIEVAFIKHATSKIQTEDDLWNIHSLGFRGEALPSIISVSKIVATTRVKENEYGVRVENNDSEVIKSRTGCAIGTIIDVQDLFYNQPVRLKFLKNPKTEFSYIAEISKSIALSNPNISFTLKNNGGINFTTSGSGDLLTLISELYSSSLTSELVEIKAEDKFVNWSVTGFASVPSYVKSSKKSIHTFLNSRVIKCPVCLRAIDLAYRNKIESGKYPFLVLNLNIPPNEIDVNVHPSKKEIRYKSTNLIFSFVQSAVEAALSGFDFRPQVKSYESFEPQGSYVQPKSDFSYANLFNKSYDEEAHISSNPRLFHEPEHGRVSTSDVMELYKPVEFNAETPKINIVGQFANTYILIDNGDNLEIVDQHIADERYNFEKLKENKGKDSQLILISEEIELEPTDLSLLESNLEKIEQFGYKIDFLSPTTITFKKLPQMVAHINPKDILADMLENIKGDLDNLETNILITTACKASVKAGQKLSLWQMEELIQNWRSTKTPHTCPHGRPISKTIPKKDIASFFNRTDS